MLKSLMDSIVSKMTDEEGLFQGGEQGRTFGRLLDLLGGGNGVHDTIDKELSSGSRSMFHPGMTPVSKQDVQNRLTYDPSMSNIRSSFTEPSRFNELAQTLSPVPVRKMSSLGTQITDLDDLMRAILGNQMPEDSNKVEDMYQLGLQRLMRPDFDYERQPGEDFSDFPLIPRDITDIMKTLSRINEN